jgi:glycosyltransferase involved in cell wall biosynthesis
MSLFFTGIKVKSLNNLPTISWFSPPGLGVGNGYGYAAVETIKALQKLGVRVPYQSERRNLSKSSDAYCHISYIQPPYYQGLAGQHRVGYTCWESTEIPEEWIEPMRRMSEVWTPCTFIEKVFREHNVNEVIRCVPHGFDPEIWKAQQRYDKGVVTFLHVGGPTERKGGQRVVDAFIDVFDGNKDAQLILKSNGPTETRLYIDGSFGSAKRHPQIHVYEDFLETEDLAKLYAAADCLVYPTNGEGFGLIPLQGIASGLPTIVTNATACADFAHLGIPLKASEAPGVGVHLGSWYEPDPQDLREKMLYVFDNFDACKERAMQSAQALHQTSTWQHSAEQILNILGDKIYQTI